MQRLDRIWCQRHLSLLTKLRLYTTLVLPVLLYASRMWTVTKLDLTHLQAFHMRCQRRILGVRWQDHVTNKAMHKRTSQLHIEQLIQAQRHSFRTCCSPTSVCSLQCYTEAHPWHIHRSSYTVGLAKAKGAAAYLVDESAQTGHRGSNTSWRHAVDSQQGRKYAMALTGYWPWPLPAKRYDDNDGPSTSGDSSTDMSSQLEIVSKENTKDFHSSDSGKARYGRGYAVSIVGR